jgi:hypothetical protein
MCFPWEHPTAMNLDHRETTFAILSEAVSKLPL